MKVPVECDIRRLGASLKAQSSIIEQYQPQKNDLKAEHTTSDSSPKIDMAIHQFKHQAHDATMENDNKFEEQRNGDILITTTTQPPLHNSTRSGSDGCLMLDVEDRITEFLDAEGVAVECVADRFYANGNNAMRKRRLLMLRRPNEQFNSMAELNSEINKQGLDKRVSQSDGAAAVGLHSLNKNGGGKLHQISLSVIDLTSKSGQSEPEPLMPLSLSGSRLFRNRRNMGQNLGNV